VKWDHAEISFGGVTFPVGEVSYSQVDGAPRRGVGRTNGKVEATLEFTVPIGWVESVDSNGVAVVSLHNHANCIDTTGEEVTDTPQLGDGT
jgi:hypothetical protein